ARMAHTTWDEHDCIRSKMRRIGWLGHCHSCSSTVAILRVRGRELILERGQIDGHRFSDEHRRPMEHEGRLGRGHALILHAQSSDEFTQCRCC
ncbi:hypothetical protein PENTCL1PPCAC_13542, partial [Pristionchus entomophagus]